mgnify:CR=1 FL=1
MLKLRIDKGRYYIGEIEVLVYPIGLPLEVSVGTENEFPPFEEVLTNLVSEVYKEGIDLTKANAYFHSEIKEIKIPEKRVLDGKVPEQKIRKFSVMCFKAVPATKENRRKLEDIFLTSI